MQTPSGWWQRPITWATVAMLVAGVALCWPYLSHYLAAEPSSAAVERNVFTLDGPPSAMPAGLDQQRPTATAVTSGEPNQVVVYISGAVVYPDVYELARDVRVKDVIVAAGGFTPDADSEQINLAARIQDEQHIHVLRVGEVQTDSVVAPSSNSEASAPSSHSDLININTASRAELEELSGIGVTLSQRIIDYRMANGPFASIEDLQQVKGIGTTLFDRIYDRLTVGE